MSDRARVITSRAFFQALTDAGIFRSDEKIYRIVIDARAGQAVIMYVEHHADERLLEVAPVLNGIEIRGAAMSESRVPRQETRGGDHPDWGKVVKGEPLPDLPAEYPEPDSEPLPDGEA